MAVQVKLTLDAGTFDAIREFMSAHFKDLDAELNVLVDKMADPKKDVTPEDKERCEELTMALRRIGHILREDLA